MRITHVVGARPNFMKAAPVLRALAELEGMEQRLVHTGQHYDRNMSEVFFEELDMPRPDADLEVGSGSHGRQTAQVLERFEAELAARRPDLVLVYGDVNSTLAATLAAAKLGVPVGHVEAGLRSFDRTMPEELNRLVTDQLADLLFTPSADADANLAREGVPAGRIRLVGNVMADTLAALLPQARDPGRLARLSRELGFDVAAGGFVLATLHRPSNVDDPEALAGLMRVLEQAAGRASVVLPAHPRTRARLDALGFAPGAGRLLLREPLGYLDCVALEQAAAVVVTDSGGMQEECTCLGVPCLTVRQNTERPVTLTQGTNTLVGRDMALLAGLIDEALAGRGRRGTVPPLWDGQAARRIAAELAAWERAR